MKEFASALDMAIATLKEAGEKLLSEIKEEKAALERGELNTYEMISKMHERGKLERMEMELLTILALLIEAAKKEEKT